jgi:phosphatidylglycerol:prolipoprotein diacylglycerol transferase
MEFTLLGAVAIAVLAAWLVLRYEAGRTNAADCTRDVWDALITAAIVGVVVGRLSAMIQAGTNPIAHLGDILIIRGGVDTVAASIAALGTYLALVRSDIRWLVDAAAPAALAGLAGWHAGCTVRASCLGTPTDLPWAVTQAGGSIGRHPVEIYAALLLSIGAVALVVAKRWRRRPGAIGALAVTIAALGRLVTEPMRPGIGGDLTWWYLVALGGGAAMTVWLLRSQQSDTRPTDPT